MGIVYWSFSFVYCLSVGSPRQWALEESTSGVRWVTRNTLRDLGFYFHWLEGRISSLSWYDSSGSPGNSGNKADTEWENLTSKRGKGG